MFDTFKALLRGSAKQPDQRAQVEHAVAALLFEMTRMETDPPDARLASARAALVALFAMSEARAAEMLTAAGAPANRLTSYFDAVSLLNRHFTLERKIALVEQLWRVAYSDFWPGNCRTCCMCLTCSACSHASRRAGRGPSLDNS